MPLTARQKYDYRDLDAGEAKLIRIGHSLWLRYKQERAKSPSTVADYEQALETVWQAKREYRAELKRKRAESFAKSGLSRGNA